MSLKGRFNKIKSKMPPEKEKDEQNDVKEKVSTWLIENKHEEFIENIKLAWRISIKGVSATQKELAEYNRLFKRVNEIVEEYSRKELKT